MTAPQYITPILRLRTATSPTAPPMVVAELELDPFDASVPLSQGDPGKRGPVGDYQDPIRFQAFIDDDADLPDDLDPEHTGWTYANTTTRDVHIWDGGAWVHVEGVLADDGPVGPENLLTISGADSVLPAQGGASITGSSNTQHLHLTLPIGDKGTTGPAGPRVPIRQSEDYVEPTDTGPLANQLLGWVGLWSPVDPRALRHVYTLGEADFTDVPTPANDAVRVAAQIVVPPQPWDWRPMVFGGLAVDANSGQSASTMTRIDMEIRVGEVDGSLIALGTGINSTREVVCRVMPFFDAEIVPESQVGVVPAGSSVTLVVVLRRIFGAREWAHVRSRGSLVVNMSPV